MRILNLESDEAGSSKSDGRAVPTAEATMERLETMHRWVC